MLGTDTILMAFISGVAFSLLPFFGKAKFGLEFPTPSDIQAREGWWSRSYLRYNVVLQFFGVFLCWIGANALGIVDGIVQTTVYILLCVFGVAVYIFSAVWKYIIRL
jgi:hypothetical protein